MTMQQTLTDQEQLANLTLDQLREVAGLVDYDAARDPFPITGWDALVWVVGNATQASLYYQVVYGMELIAYAGPETGVRDRQSYVLKSGAAPFVLTVAVAGSSPMVAVHSKHADGISAMALQAPDAYHCIAHARAQV